MKKPAALDLAQFEEVQPVRQALDLSAFEEVGQEPVAPARPKTSWFGSLARGALQGATMGFADEIAGGAEALFTSKTYKQARDESRANFKQAAEDNPLANTIGQVGGGLATAIIPAGAIVKGTGFAAHAMRGAGAGILSGIGSSEADNVQDIARDAAKSGLTGAAVGGVLGTAGEKLLKGAQGRVDQRLMGDLGHRAHKNVRDKMADFAPKTLETVRKFGLDKAARDPEKLVEGAAAARQQVGARIGEIYEEADRVFLGVKAKDVAAALAATKRKHSSPADAPLRRQIDGLIDEVKESWGKGGARARVPLAKVNELATKLENVGFASPTLTPAAGTALKRDMAGAVNKVLRQRMDEIQQFSSNVKGTWTGGQSKPLADSMSAADGLRELVELNGNYRALKLVEKAAQQRTRLDPFPANGIRQIAGGALDTGALLASLGTGSPLPYLATKVGIPAAKAGARAADVALAKLVAAAERGSVTAAMIQQAITAGVPRGLVERFSTSIGAAPTGSAGE